jgi:hypothetical protein
MPQMSQDWLKSRLATFPLIYSISPIAAVIKTHRRQTISVWPGSCIDLK